MVARPTRGRETSTVPGGPVSVALTVLFVLVALVLVAGGLYLFASGLAARADACRPPLGLRLRNVESGSREWQRAHRAAWPILFCGGVLGTAHGIALAAMPFMDAPASIPFVFVLSGVIVEVGMWLVARGAGKAALR